MSTGLVLGGILIAVGLLDLLLGRFLLPARLPDPRTRRLVVNSVYAGGLMFVILGILVLTGVIAF